MRHDAAQSLTLSAETVTSQDLFLGIQVAAAAGFDGLGVRPEDYLAAREQGRSDRELRVLLADNDVTCRELHCARGWADSPDSRAQARLRRRAAMWSLTRSAFTIRARSGPDPQQPGQGAAEQRSLVVRG